MHAPARPPRRLAPVLAFLALAPAPQETARLRATVAPTPRPPVIDGRLDDEVWRLAAPIGELVQVDPVEGAAPSEASDIRLLHDRDYLYLGIRCFDRDPRTLLTTTRERDGLLEVDDRVEIVIDTFHDRRNAFFFQINAGGSKGDALVTNNGADFNKPWDGIWEGIARVDEQGWSAELALPFKTLNFAEGVETWGFNIERFIGRKREECRWSGARRDYSLFQIYEAGELHGLSGIDQGIGLDVVPFFVADWLDEGQGGDEDLRGEPGFDAFYKIIPSLTLALTVNTDFAETEVDERQINLTRFPLFFPERRDFFLQDAGLFEFGPNASGGGDGGTALIPFFSRRIGLSEDGREIPILAGAKLTGRAGEYGIGVLDVQTDELDELDGQNLFAGRITRNVGEQSTVGAILTNGDPQGEADNRVYGFDASYRTSAFRGDKNLIASAYWLASDSEDVPGDLDVSGLGDVPEEGDGQAFGAALRSPNDLWTWELDFLEIQEDFEAALGFVPRKDIRRYLGELVYAPRPELESVRQLEFALSALVFTDTRGEVETWTALAQPLGIEFESGDRLSFQVEQDHDEIFEDFEISEGVIIPVGEYDFARAGFELETAEKRAVSLALGLEGGEFFDGQRTDYGTGLFWRPGPFFIGSLEYERNDVSLEGGDFDTEIASLRARFSFSPELSWNNFLQWDSESDTFGIQSQLRWIPAAHQEMFLVLNETLENEDGLSPLFQELTFKIAYAFRF